MPYWTESEERDQARWRLGGVVALTLACTGVSVLFNFLGRDFFNALSEKDVERFTVQLYKWFAAVLLGVPVFVYRDYYQVGCLCAGGVPWWVCCGGQPWWVMGEHEGAVGVYVCTHTFSHTHTTHTYTLAHIHYTHHHTHTTLTHTVKAST